MLNINAIVERIEEIRSNHQLSAAAFASKIGVQRSAMSHILSGRNKPSLEFLMKIYDAFEEVSLEWLIIGATSPTNLYNSDHLLNTVEENKEHNKLVEYPTTNEIESPKHLTHTSKNSLSPKEIIYLYSDGSFERFTPKD